MCIAGLRSIKRILVFLILTIPCIAHGQDTDSIYYVDLKMTGVFQGESLYVQNPYYSEISEFCVREVRVNKKRVNLNYQLSALKIDFTGVSMNSPVYIDVNHMAQCAPRIVNPLAIYYHSNFKYTKLLLNDSILYWETKGDSPEGKYHVEQLNGDYWAEVDVIDSKGVFEGTSYDFAPFHLSGSNKFRIKYQLPSGRYLYSDELEYVYYKEPITFNIASNRMIFSIATEYEILDSKGNTVIQGEGKEIPLRLMKPGEYVIFFDGGRSESFVKK